MRPATTLLCLSVGILLLSALPIRGHIASTNIENDNLLQIQSESVEADLISNPSLRCGGTLTNNSNGIVYKPFENVVPNERCVWIIGVPGAVGYDIDVLRLGSPINKADSGIGLSITGVHHRRFLDNPPEFTYHAPNATGQFRVENATFVVVTLYSSSGTDDSTGFILEYNSLFNGNISSNTASTHHISPPSTIDFRYPAEGNYSTYELAAFVFPPKDNLYKSGNVEHVAFDISGIKENCWDVIFLYTLNVTAPIGGRAWSYPERICHYSPSKVFSHEDVGLAVFQSSTTSVQGHSFGYSVFGC